MNKPVLLMIALSTALLGVSCMDSRFTASPPPKAASLAPNVPPDGWRRLYDGTSASAAAGWEMVGPGAFEQSGRDLVTYGGMGMLWYSREKLGNCQIRVVFKTSKKSDNAGVFIRIPDRPIDPWFAVNKGYEVQIANASDDYHRNGTLYSISKALAKVELEPGTWNTYIIRLDGKRTKVEVNGQLVTDFKEGDAVPPQSKWYEPTRGERPEKGYIGLQNHDYDTRVHFREVAVRPLPANTASR